jgi:hypothetical protein
MQAPGIGASAMAKVTVEHSMVSGGEADGLAVDGAGSTLTVTDVLVESAGANGIVARNDGSATVDGSSVAGSTTYGLFVEQGEVTAKHVVVENSGADGASSAGDGTHTATLTLQDSAVLVSAAAGVTATAAGAHSVITRTLIADTTSDIFATETTLGGVFATTEGEIDVTDSAVVRSIFVGVGVFGPAKLTLTRVLIEDSLPDPFDMTYGLGFAAASPGAISKLDSVAITGSHVAGFLAQGVTDANGVQVSGCLVTGTALGGVTDANTAITTDGIGDGVAATLESSVLLERTRIENNGRAGVLFADSGGSLRLVISTKNEFGAVFDGNEAPMVDDQKTISGNTHMDIFNAGNLPVPTVPAPAPQ